MKKSSLLESHGSVGQTGARPHELTVHLPQCLPLPVIIEPQVSLFYQAADLRLVTLEIRSQSVSYFINFTFLNFFEILISI